MKKKRKLKMWVKVALYIISVGVGLITIMALSDFYFGVLKGRR